MRRECLRRAHDLFVMERGTAIDGVFDAAASLLEREVAHLTGGLVDVAVAVAAR